MRVNAFHHHTTARPYAFTEAVDTLGQIGLRFSSAVALLALVVAHAFAGQQRHDQAVKPRQTSRRSASIGTWMRQHAAV